MQTIEALVSDLGSRGISLRLEDGRLRYTAPQGALTPRDLAKLRARKPELIAFLQGARRARDGGKQILRPTPRPEDWHVGMPVSFAQQRLWFLQRFDEQATAYNEYAGLRLLGTLDLPALLATVQTITQRHEMLRTTFPTVDGLPRQRIHPSLPPAVTLVDLQTIAAADRNDHAHVLLGQAIHRPFDLAQGPLLRLLICRCTPTDHLLVFTLHHIVGDVWSTAVLARELTLIYGAYAARQAHDLLPLTIQYADFAAHQRRWLDSEAAERQRDYWREHLRDLPAMLALPTDRPRRAQRGEAGGETYFQMDTARRDACRQLAQRHEATLFMVLLANFAVLLSRLSGQRDFAVGSPIANRDRSELEPLIGLLVNLVVLRCDLHDEPNFATVLQRTRKIVLDAFAHQDVPFEQVVDVVQPTRATDHQPLFQVVFALQNLNRATLQLPGLTLKPISPARPTAKFDLMLQMTESDQGLAGRFEFATDLFDEASMVQMGRLFSGLLEAATAAPHVPVTRLSLVDNRERQRMLRAMQSPAVALPVTCLHARFWQQARQHPDAIALVGPTPTRELPDTWLSYGQVAMLAYGLARRLRARGVRAGDRVVVMLPRDVRVAVAILAVLHCGAAYVPIDPAYPVGRRNFLLEDSEPHLVLSDEVLAGWPCMRVGLEPEASFATALDRPLAAHDPWLPAYHIYTSGSTGQPKGVVVSHHNVARLLAAGMQLFHFQAKDVWSWFHSYAFDFSVWEMWGAWWVGARTVQVPVPWTMASVSFARLLRDQAVSVLNQTPSAFYALSQTDHHKHLAHLHTVIFGGEALAPARLASWQARHPSVRLVNMYGITETTVHVTAQTLGKSQVQDDRSAIGEPLADLQMFLLDAWLEPVPTGVPGLLFVAGAGVTQGYWRRPGLTASRFLPHPYAAQPGERLYHSGDKALRNHRGEWIYLGRADAQVQLRGFRIEPAEVAAVLNALPGVKDAAVVLRHDDGQPQLVAYVVVERFSERELRTAAEQQLPAHQVPAAFVQVPHLPRTAHGKLDRDALPRPQQNPATYTAPRNEVEQVVCTVWADVLGREPIGVDDHFFTLGGHSLLAAQVTAALQTHFGFELPLRDFFTAPTPAGQAAAIQRLRETDLSLPSPRHVAPNEPVPLSFAQERLWFLERLEAGVYNVPFALTMWGDLDVAALERALRCVAQRQTVLTAVFPAVDGQPRLDQITAAALQVTRMDLTAHEAGEALAKDLAAAMAGVRFNLERGPLLRALVLQLADRHWVLLVTLHHTIADGHSTAILLNEWTTAYRQVLGTEAVVALPNLPANYGDFAAWQREIYRQGHLEEAEAFWREHLGDVPPLLLLPTDRPRPPVQDFRGNLLTVPHDPAVVAQLRALAQQSGVTLFVVFQAALVVLLSRLAAQNDLVLATPASHRRHGWWQPLLGLFLNTVVFRHRVDARLSWRQWLLKVRDETQRAFSHGDVPFERIVEMLDLPRTRSHNPLFQVMLIQQPPPAPLPQLPGLRSQPMTNPITKSKFDLSLYVAHDGQQAAFEYSTALFDEATIQQWGTYWRRLLASLANDPQLCLGDLQLMDAATRQLLLEQWHCDHKEPEAPADLSAMWTSQVARCPDRVAITDGWCQLTYGESDRMMRRCAGGLRDRGVRRGDVVGIALPRSCELPLAVLGTWAAGAAYLPLDPTYPDQRRQAMQRIAQCRGVIGNQQGDSWSMAALLRSEPASCQPSAAAYVIFTSGSTGQPKGVWMAQAPLARLIRWQSRGLAASRVLNFTSLGFDVAFQEMWSTWVTGGTLVMVAEAVRRDAEALLVWLKNQCVARLFMPYAALQNLAECAQHEVTGLALREIITAGETLILTPALRAFLGALPECQLDNHYGPSETHVVTAYSLTGAVGNWPQRPPIGRAVAAGTVYVLDQNMRPVAPGLTGQLALGGALAFGYVSAPALTAARFVPHPFANRGGARLYLTGDLARFNRHGELDFLGRRDFQCKVRGYRVELMEVEQALASMAGVIACAVVAHGERNDGPVSQLSAFYVSVEEDAVTGDHLRQALLHKLPAFMVPSRFIPLDSLPQLPNGKVDRMRLVQQAMATPATHTPSDPPQGPLESLIARAFAEVLNLNEVGRDCDFFDAGGHSLSAARVMARIRRDTARDCPLGWLFDAPTPAALAAVLARAETTTDAAVGPVRPVTRDQPLPVSFAQQRLWFLDRLTKGHLPTYHMPFALRMRGPLDLLAFQRAVWDLLQRHESLRTHFSEVADQPVQVIVPAWQVAVPVIDLDHESGNLVQVLAAAEAVQPFVLERVPLWRLKVLRLSNDDHVLLLTKHHIISDGWSLGVMVRELIALYRGHLMGRPAQLPSLPVQYADVAVWQRRHLDGERRQALLQYWREALSGAPRRHQLPTDRPRPARMQTAAAVVHLALDRDLTRQLQQVAGQHKVTWFMLLEAAFGLLMARLSGQPDVLIGTPTANRPQAEMESLIGFFVNTLVLRNDLRGVDDWPTYLQWVKRMTLAAFDHGELPFELLVEALQPERDLGHTPLFQVMFVLQNTPASELNAPGLSLEPLAWAPPNAKYDITLSVQENDSGALISAEYSTALFDRESMQVLLSAYRSLLRTAVTDETRPLHAWPLLEPSLREQVVQAWNQTAQDDPLMTMLERLNHTARNFPARIALAWHGNPDEADEILGGPPRLLTYGYMEHAAHRLAGALVQRGVKPGDLVGVLLDRSPAAFVAFWAIWQVGAAYVPLDPQLPSQRLAWMIKDSGLALMVTAQSATDVAHPGSTLEVEPATGLPLLVQAPPVTVSPVAPCAYAYMIYTSGSTGHPKGALIQHQSLANLAGHHCRTGIAQADCRTLLFVALSFDASVWQWLTAHAAGGTLVVPKPAVALLGANLARWLRTYAITHITMTPSALAELEPDAYPALRVLTSGGEACSLSLFRTWSQGRRFINAYGPTEATICCAQLDSARHQLADDQRPVPIGWPGANVQHYVLDRWGELMPPGVPGELAIGGIQVGGGYHRRPALTAQRFVPDPFSTSGRRLYLTGDRARWRHDGQMEFLGRLDRQVKLRGYRIEPGEIEACCRASTLVRDVAVVVNHSGGERLAAFITLNPSGAAEGEPAGVIRRQLQAQLPAYQVPAAIVVLDQLPTTAHDKVDLAALAGKPLAQWADQSTTGRFTAPETETEQRLAKLWQALLERDRISRYEHFFDAGGHSLLAVRLMNAVSREFGLNLPLENLFEEPTLHKLAQLIDLLAAPAQATDDDDEMEEGAL